MPFVVEEEKWAQSPKNSKKSGTVPKKFPKNQGQSPIFLSKVEKELLYERTDFYNCNALQGYI